MVPKAPRRQIVDVQDILTSICTKWGLLVLYELSKGLSGTASSIGRSAECPRRC
jgi:DNA-binding HxlR family transcriptional regulator